MLTSDTIKDLSAALSKAQSVITAAKKDSANPHFKSKYADLSSIWDACRAALTDNGLSVIQSPGPCTGGVMELTTRLMHSSGQWIEGTLTIPIGKPDAQGYGSATTYARRYALAAMVGVAPDDDDGNAASRPRQDAVPEERDAPFPKGPAKNKTELKALGKDFWRDVEACGDLDELDILLDNNQALMSQLIAGLPLWWNGGERAGMPYDGLSAVIDRTRESLMDQANAGWQSNPLNAG